MDFGLIMLGVVIGLGVMVLIGTIASWKADRKSVGTKITLEAK